MKGSSFWVWSSICLFVLSLLLGMALVWVNIERVDISYELTSLNQDLEGKEQLRDKLEVERNNLLSSYRLTTKAKEFGLQPPKPGQVRRLSPN
jgi:cell division protein FtsL